MNPSVTSATPKILRCAMENECTAEVTHADHKGYVYCATHGVERKRSGIRCRKLTKTEIRKLAASEPITY